MLKRLLIFLFLIYSSIYSESFLGPLKIKNQYMFYLPYLFIPSESYFDYKPEIRCSFYKSNTFLSYFSMDYRGIIDLETSVLTGEYVYYLSDFKFTLSLSYVYDGGGYLDPIIEGFHHAFGLRNGGRHTWGTNKMYVWFEEKNILINKAVYGFSDPSIYVSKELISINPYIVYTVGFKPNIYSNSIINTSSWDFGNYLSFNYFWSDIFLYSGFGFVFIVGNDFYKKYFYRKRDFILNFNIGSGIKIIDGISFIINFYFQRSPYSSNISRIDSLSIVNSYGFRIEINKDITFQFSADEDSFTFSTTDISFNFNFEFKL